MGQLDRDRTETGGERLLIIDDHPLTARGIALALQVCLPDATSETVASIDAAMDILDDEETGARPFRLIVLDYNLPDISGFAGLSMVQAAAPTIPVVLVSASVDARLIDTAAMLGAVGFVSKTHPLDHFALALRRIIAALPDTVTPDRSRSLRWASRRDCVTVPPATLPPPHR